MNVMKIPGGLPRYRLYRIRNSVGVYDENGFFFDIPTRYLTRIVARIHDFEIGSPGWSISSVRG